MANLDDVGIVVIGRNEGQRLVQCLSALNGTGTRMVYADSGSTDGSVEEVRRMGIDVIVLDDSRPHTAARGRNAGFKYLSNRYSQLRFVQFLDGDCEIAPGWLENAVQELRTHDELVMVCGRLRERFAERSVYDRLCEMEWNTHVGETRSCGGNCMVCVTAFAAAGGFDRTITAGEEPELCWRMRRTGGRIWRLPADMAIHDAAMHTFSQWWWRQVRAGHAAAENADLHGRVDRKHYVRDVASNLTYGVLVPAAAGLTAYVSGLASVLLILTTYAGLLIRVRAIRRHRGDCSFDANVYAVFTVIGKFAQVLGLLIYLWRHKILKGQSQLIEYKDADQTRCDSFRD